MIYFLKNFRKFSSQAREKGAALVVTLLVLVLFAVLITGFLVATRIETAASRNFAYQNIAEKMAYLGAERAIAQLNSANLTSNATTSFFSQPGRFVVNGTSFPLTSASLNAIGARNINLNQSRSLQTNANSNLFVVPAVPNIVTTGGSSITNGRYAYWIDDDGTKANPNAMMPNRLNFIATNSRPLSAGVFSSGFATQLSNAMTSTSLTNLWGYFFTPLQAPAMSGTLTNELFYISAGPPNLTNAFAFTTNNRINLNGNLTTNTVGGARYGINFLQSPSGSSALTNEINNLINTQIDSAVITSRFGNRTFTQKYSPEVLGQILVNINDLNLATGVSANPGNTATTGAGFTNSDGIPLIYSGLRRFIHLNEIACKAAYSTNSPCGSAVEFQIWFAVELVNPYPVDWGDAAQITFGITDFSANVSYQLNGSNFSTNIPSPPSAAPQTSGTNGIDLFQSVAATNYADSSMGRKMTFAFEYQAWKNIVGWGIPGAASNVTIPRMSFRPTYVKLLQWANSNPTIRDWAVSSDFSQHGSGGLLTFSNIPLVTGGIKTNGSAAPNYLATPANNISNFNIGTLGIAKNDPRVRTFPAWTFNSTAWSWVGGNSPNSVTLGSANNGTVNFNAPTGRPNLPSDPTTATAPNIFTHPSLTNGFRAMLDNLPYRSVMELGNVHTGLQWRTLQLCSQNAMESSAGLVPDWALMDAFYISNSIPKLNINSFVYPAATNSGGATTLATQAAAGLLRTPALESLVAGGTNNVTAADSLSANSRMSTSSASQNFYRSIASNIALMNFTNTWSNRRASLGTNAFPPNQYAMLGEVLEVARVANFTDSDAINEGRAASFIDAMSLHSDVFSIYSFGEALDRQGRSVGEFLLRTQVQLDRATGRFRPVFTEPVRASNLPMP